MGWWWLCCVGECMVECSMEMELIEVMAAGDEEADDEGLISSTYTCR